MRLVLLYPPPGKLSLPEETQGLRQGVPKNYLDRLIKDGDFLTAPYGILSLAAQAMRAGHDVFLFNLSNFPWPEVEELIRHIEADLFALSCHASNRSGVDLTAKLIRAVYPNAHIVCGGPFVSSLPAETLTYYREIDTVVIGEGEATFLELIQRLEAGQSTAGLSGTAWRNGEGVYLGPPRKRIEELDSLASPLDYFPARVLVTSRGCPGECTFCGSKGMWGRKVTFHSANYVLNMLEKAVRQHGQQYIAFKDDTFTANRARALMICQGILERRLNLFWSCDTRVDRLDEELLYWMRAAGCQRISFGVESGSPAILRNIKKHISTQQILEATRLAQKYGFWVRYYLITGHRGESPETLRETRDLIEQAKPNELVTSGLSIYPGTEEFELLQAAGVSPEIFFRENELSIDKALGTTRAPELESDLSQDKIILQDVPNYADYSVEDLLKILERLPDNAAAHMDLAGAYCRIGAYAKAGEQVQLALKQGYPCLGLAFNYLACIAAGKQDYAAVIAHLSNANRIFPHAVVTQNLMLFHAWFKEGDTMNAGPLALIAHSNSFEKIAIHQQPEKPGPIVLRDKAGKIHKLGCKTPQATPLYIQC
jgi:anaerobic magnesium-protoporphyrin IX monomethyl ester cyclase